MITVERMYGNTKSVILLFLIVKTLKYIAILKSSIIRYLDHYG
jgi:hypothetical protein